MIQRTPLRHLSTAELRARQTAWLVALLLLLIGLLRGEARLVLQRAIQICLGCIGIG